MDSSEDSVDKAIVAKVVGGDVDAYADLMARYQAKLQRYVTYLIHDQTASHDVVQETFIKAYQNLNGFNSKYKFSSWIYRIAHNEAMNEVKKLRHMSDSDIDELPESGYDPHMDEKLDKDILKAHVQGCVTKLEPKYREVVQLVYFEHMKYEEVSEVLHVPVSTVGVWLSRSKKMLKEICESRGVKQ